MKTDEVLFTRWTRKNMKLFNDIKRGLPIWIRQKGISGSLVKQTKQKSG